MVRYCEVCGRGPLKSGRKYCFIHRYYGAERHPGRHNNGSNVGYTRKEWWQPIWLMMACYHLFAFVLILAGNTWYVIGGFLILIGMGFVLTKQIEKYEEELYREGEEYHTMEMNPFGFIMAAIGGMLLFGTIATKAYNIRLILIGIYLVAMGIYLFRLSYKKARGTTLELRKKGISIHEVRRKLYGKRATPAEGLNRMLSD
jgi:uncharacterized membrane protein